MNVALHTFQSTGNLLSIKAANLQLIYKLNQVLQMNASKHQDPEEAGGGGLWPHGFGGGGKNIIKIKKNA